GLLISIILEIAIICRRLRMAIAHIIQSAAHQYLGAFQHSGIESAGARLFYLVVELAGYELAKFDFAGGADGAGGLEVPHGSSEQGEVADSQVAEVDLAVGLAVKASDLGMGEHAQHFLAEPADVAARILAQFGAPGVGCILKETMFLVELIFREEVAIKRAARDLATGEFRKLVE